MGKMIYSAFIKIKIKNLTVFNNLTYLCAFNERLVTKKHLPNIA